MPKVSVQRGGKGVAQKTSPYDSDQEKKESVHEANFPHHLCYPFLEYVAW